MKTFITSILPAFLILLTSNATIAGNKNSHPFNFKTNAIVADTLGLSVVPINQIVREDETYVNDIPFDTREIIAGYHATINPVNEPESYVNDIPFDTREITAGYLAAINPVNEPESYVNDIPFRTDSIAHSYFPARFNSIFPESESYINDIPFDTEMVAGKYLSKTQSKFCCSAN